MQLTKEQMAEARKMMIARIEECTDNSTGEVNCTKLAELVADEKGWYDARDQDNPIPCDDLFDLACEFSDDEDVRRGAST